MSAIVFEHSLALHFFGVGMKTDLFQTGGHCWVFQICWHIECSTLTASSFRLWKSPTGILSPPLALFVVTFPKAHLTSHSRVSGPRWMTMPLWSARSLRPFLYSSSVYSCHLFLISSAFVTSLPFLSFIMPISAWDVPLVSLIFLKRLLVFPILLFYFISLHCSLEKAFLSLLAILRNSTLRWVYLSISPLPFTSPTEMTSKTQSQLMRWEGGAWMLQAVELMKELWGWGSPWPIPNQARGQDGREREGRCCQRLSWGLDSWAAVKLDIRLWGGIIRW